ncbi:hypothetical protein LCGC14_2269590 [marine sediment metagenome]|uniref:Uncharacterized protein n=1 Tax=marine sediment metagenome TaxID=412755 RepID=A0A0F9F9R9_9ZZZZ
MNKGTLNYFEAKPEEKKVEKLIMEFEGEGEFYRALEELEKRLLSDFINWLYLEKQYMIIPQEIDLRKAGDALKSLSK